MYNTYYYDRFYYPGQELTKHADRDACEISISVHVSTNLEGKDADWALLDQDTDTYTDKKKTTVLVPGENRSLVLKPGDGLLYKGCERPHWRDPMPGVQRRRTKNCLVRRLQRLNFIAIKSSSIMFFKMETEATVHGMSTMKAPLLNVLPINIRSKTGSSRRKVGKRIKEEKFVRTDLQTFKFDRQTNKKSYLHYFRDLIKDELWEFVQEAQVTCSMTDVWTVRYQKGDQQTILAIRSKEFTGIFMLSMTPKFILPLVCSTMARS